MTTNPAQVIVTVEDGGEPHVYRAHAHHRDFPEIQAEGESPSAAAERLLASLAVALEHAPSHWRQEAILHAIDEVKAFVEQSSRP